MDSRDFSVALLFRQLIGTLDAILAANGFVLVIVAVDGGQFDDSVQVLGSRLVLRGQANSREKEDI